MKKIFLIILACILAQSCIRCYKEKEYSFEKSDITKNINIEGIEKMDIIGSLLSFHIEKNKISNNLFLEDIKIYYKEEFLGEIIINKKIINIPYVESYTPDGKVIKKIELIKEMVEILEEQEVKLKINEEYMSEELTFVYEFYDSESTQKFNRSINYRLSKHDKGCRIWIPNI